MAEKITQNGFLSGTNGTLWVNGRVLAELSSYEAKVTGAFDDVDCCGEYATFQQYHGYKIDGTITIHKVDSALAVEVERGYTSGIMPEITLTSKHENPSTGAAERIAIRNVVITEFTAAKFEAKSVTDVDFPFTGTRLEYLEEI